MDRIHHDQTTREQFVLDLGEIARQGAEEMLASALQAEVQAYLTTHSRRVRAIRRCLNDSSAGVCSERNMLSNRPEMALLAFLDTDAAVRG